jgi:plasmid stability protein
MSNIQYTIRDVPAVVDKEIRLMSKRSGRSMNAISVEALRIGLNIRNVPEPNHNLDKLFGTLSKENAAAINRASYELRSVDSSDW